MRAVLSLFVVLCISAAFAIECNPNGDCKTCRQCDRNMVECSQKVTEKPAEQQEDEQCKCFTSYWNCVKRVGCLYFPHTKEWCEGFSSDLCPGVCDKPEKIGDVPTEATFSIYDAGTQLSPVCDDGGKFEETVPLGVCLENDEYLAYRLDVVDGFVSKGGEGGQKVPGLKLQWQFGCKKDENGECFECGHMGESFPDVCTWGCQVKTPEESCFSFWGSGWAKELNPYKAVSLNVTMTTNKDCDADEIQNFIERITEEGARESSLNSKMERKQWFCRTIPAPEVPAAKRQTPEDPQITDLWVEFAFTGENPRVGAEQVSAMYNGGNSDLITFGSREGVTVEHKGNTIDIFAEEDSGISGAAVFGIIVLVIVILAIVGVAAYFIMAKGKSTEFA